MKITITILNLTLHDIGIVGPDGAVVRKIPRSGLLLGETMYGTKTETVDGIPVVRDMRWELFSKPPPEKHGVMYIIDRHQVESFPGRQDMLWAEKYEPTKGSSQDEVVLLCNELHGFTPLQEQEV